MSQAKPSIVIDRTHLGRRATGIERITRDLFSDESLAPLRVRGTRMGAGRLRTLIRQTILNPADAVLRPRSVWVFPGFPPSPAFRALSDRSVLYVHDLFLIERPGDLNRAARFYMAPAFRSALRSFRFFLANSDTTSGRLRPHIHPASEVALYRPPARDVLGLSSIAGTPRRPACDPVRIGMIGTIEPRKNYGAAIEIAQSLEARLGRPVELHVVGRRGWSEDAERLARARQVHLHGFVDDGAVAELAGRWSLFLSTSHDEGLGLPLLEIQHAGLPVVAPDSPVFREVLGASGTYIDPARPHQAAEAIAALLGSPADAVRNAAFTNIERWNRLASRDHAAVIDLLAGRLAALGQA